MKTAFVSGAGSGIGRAAALLLAEHGCAVAIMDVSADGAGETAEKVCARGGSAEAFIGDVSNERDVRAAVEGAEATFGPLDVTVTCAGIELFGNTVDMTMSDWERSLAVNLSGTMLVARHAIPSMIGGGGGAFIAISSDAGILGVAGWTPYCVSKHAVIGLVRCLALDFGPKGVRSNVVCPSFVETPMTERIFADTNEDVAEWKAKVPLGRFADPREVANVVCHLASDQASYTNGHVYMMDGGATAGFS